MCALIIGLSASANAQQVVSEGAGIDILPAKSVLNAPEHIEAADTTHSALNLTPDKSELVRLKDDAASVIVGNPAHVSVLAESSKLLVFIPRQPGATYVTVLGQDGSVIMQRHVIIGSGKDKYVRIRRSCSGAEGCQETQTFYCPDMCHAIAGAEGEGNAATSATAGQRSGGGGDSQAVNDDEENTQE